MKCFKCGKVVRGNVEIECEAPGDICILKEARKSRNRDEGWINFLVAGVRGSGKTYFLYSLIQQILEPQGKVLEKMEQMRLRVSHFEHNTASRRIFEDLKFEIQVAERQLEATLVHERWDPIIISLKNRERRRTTHLAFFNLSGEFFENPDSMNEHQQILTADGICLLLDPLQIPQLSKYAENPHNNRPNNNLDIVDNIKYVISEAQRNSQVKLTNPVSFCISKFDVLEKLSPHKIDDPYLTPSDIFTSFGEFRKRTIEDNTEHVLEFLDKEDYRKLRHLNERFSSHAVFAIAPIGHDNIKTDRTPNPKGIFAPFFWLLSEYKIIESDQS